MKKEQLERMYRRAHTVPQMIYASVRWFPHQKNPPFSADDYAVVLRFIERMTPHQFMQMFPIDKTYDCERWESKDYFTTKEMCFQRGFDSPIGDAFTFLWDYCNPYTRCFLSGVLKAVDQERRLDGKPSMLESFFEEQGIGIPAYRRFEAPNGKAYFQNTKTGEFLKEAPSRPKKPSWWKVIEGGKQP